MIQITEQEAFQLLTSMITYNQLQKKLLGLKDDPSDLLNPAIKILLDKCIKLEIENGRLKTELSVLRK